MSSFNLPRPSVKCCMVVTEGKNEMSITAFSVVDINMPKMWSDIVKVTVLSVHKILKLGMVWCII